MNETYPLPLQGKPEREHLYEWMSVEEEYVGKKFDDGIQRQQHDTTLAAYDLDFFWVPQITQYLDRARMFVEQAHEYYSGSDEQRALELKAQQALAKGMMTFKGLVESCIRVYGNLPEPGVPSGEIKEQITRHDSL